MTSATILPIILSALIGSWCMLLFRYVQAVRKIRRGGEPSVCYICSRNMSTVVKSIGTSMTYPGEIDGPGIYYQDKDGDGVPDVFQRRKPVSEILEFEKPSVKHANDYWVAIELPARPPSKDEYFLYGNKINKASHDYMSAEGVIIKSVPGTNLDDLVEISK